MDNKTPILSEDLFTVADVAGTTYRITESAQLGSLAGDPSGWWFDRDKRGNSRFNVQLAGSSRTVQYTFSREEEARMGKRCVFTGSDGSIAHVYA